MMEAGHAKLPGATGRVFDATRPPRPPEREGEAAAAAWPKALEKRLG
jgi:hypothetical protein